MKSYVNLSIMTFFLAFLGSCATAPTIDTDPASRLATAMAGTYLRTAADSSGPLQDQRIRLDNLGPGQWLYYQVNEGDQYQDIYRQRVLNLRNDERGRVLQTAYILNDPTAYQTPTSDLSSLTRQDLSPGLEPGCDMIWIEMEDGWAGQIDPKRCVIFSDRQQSNSRIGARADLNDSRLRQAETGYDMDGNQIWGLDDGEWIVLYRTQ